MDAADSELIDSYLNGSDADFERLYRRYRQPLYGYLRSMLPAADADDVFQQTWVRVCAALPGYRCRGKFAAWLFRIGRNLAVDLQRRRHCRRELELADDGSDCPVESEWDGDWADAALLRQLGAALRQLSPEQRAVFEMRRRDIAFKVIAARQDCSVNTAIVRMGYAMKKLQRALREFRR